MMLPMRKNSALDRLQNTANQLLTDINNATTNAQVNQIQNKERCFDS